jgi:beta-mannosidase
LRGRVELEIYQRGKLPLATAQVELEVPARGAKTLSADGVLERFFDITYAYRFGPAKHDLVVARIEDIDGRTLAEDFYFPLGLSLPQQDTANIRVEARFEDDGHVIVTLQSDVFLQSVALAIDDFLPDANYFHLAPNREKRIACKPLRDGIGKFKAYLSALNYGESLTLRAEKS